MIPNADITLYNKYHENRAEKYQRVVIRRVVWQSQKAISQMRFQSGANSLVILIPFALGTQYVSPRNWLWEDKPSTHWTLQEGDVVVRGEVEDEITDLFTITQLRATYDEVFTINSIDAMDEGSPNVQHWEVGCK